MLRASFALAFLFLVAVGACVQKVPLPAISTPQFPDFLAPVVPAEFEGTPAADRGDRGWRFLQAGDLMNARREFSTALEAAPAFYPADVGLGYVDLAASDPQSALIHFDRTLARQPAEPSALVGLGEANLGLNREDEALAAFEAASAAAPSLRKIAQRVEVLRFRGAERRIVAARAAAGGGRIEEAIRAYAAAIANSPGSAFLYRELAGVERQRGDAAAALAHFRTALDLDPSDPGSLTGLGDLLEASGEFDAAAKAYADAIAVEPTAVRQARFDVLRARAELERLPVQYRAIEQAPEITRGELAALIGVRLAPLLQPDVHVDAEPITDVREDWAASWILTVARAGVMEPFANHAFQPRSPVQRIELAQAVERLLARVAVRKPAAARAWETARLPFTDLASGHLAYPAASAAVASGVLAVAPDGSFRPSVAVTGGDAVATIERLEALADLSSPSATRR